MQIVRLGAADYDECLSVLNTTFTKQNKKIMNFEKELPKMCVRDDCYMRKHFAVKENGKICAIIGVYPLKTMIGGSEFTFSTVGNVATLPGCEGRGYMRCLMEAAMKELEEIGADASWLGGDRQRYNRYGYEVSGITYDFIISGYTTKCCADDTTVEFKKVGAEDCKELEFINNLRKTRHIYVERSEDKTYLGDYLTMCAWRSTPYIVLDDMGSMIGYLCAAEDKAEIAEVIAKDLQSLKNIIFNWQKRQGVDVRFTLMPFEDEAVRYFSGVAAEVSLNSPSHFKIINFDKIADALIKLKASYNPKLPYGTKVIGIEGWGNLKIEIEKDKAYCEKTEAAANIVLDKLSATRLLFGPFSAETVVEADGFLSSVLPLPLSWNTLDRV